MYKDSHKINVYFSNLPLLQSIEIQGSSCTNLAYLETQFVYLEIDAELLKRFEFFNENY